MQDQRAMVQTEDHFTSLTHAVAALLSWYGMPVDLDHVAGTVGDCFALRLVPERRLMGLTEPLELVEEGLGDLGVQARLITRQISDDNELRVATILTASVRNRRPALVCGGWPAGAIGDRDYVWGIVHTYDQDERAFLGSALQELLVGESSSEPLTWPAHGDRVLAGFLMDTVEAPPPLPRKLARRALDRGLALLAGEGTETGIGAYTHLLEWLRTQDQASTPHAFRYYPHPVLTAVRCQLECMVSFLRGIAGVVPRNRRAAHRRLLNLARDSAQLILQSEPARAYRRQRPTRHAMQPPWPPEAWDPLREALADPGGPARRAEMAKIEQLRQRHLDMVEALDMVLAR